MMKGWLGVALRPSGRAGPEVDCLAALGERWEALPGQREASPETQVVPQAERWGQQRVPLVPARAASGGSMPRGVSRPPVQEYLDCRGLA
jgi:hypothetical protein